MKKYIRLLPSMEEKKNEYDPSRGYIKGWSRP